MRGMAAGMRLARNEPRHRLNALCPYFTMFPLDFPLRALGRAKPGDRVLDPFCGRGTMIETESGEISLHRLVGREELGRPAAGQLRSELFVRLSQELAVNHRHDREDLRR